MVTILTPMVVTIASVITIAPRASVVPIAPAIEDTAQAGQARQAITCRKRKEKEITFNMEQLAQSSTPQLR